MSDSHAADVQAELQQYLNSKNINSLFISIVENLLIEKPANPIAFMIEYLYKQFPDQAKEAIEALSPAVAPVISVAAAASTTPSTATSPTAAATSATSAPTAADDDSEDDEDDYVGDMREVAVAKPKPKDRRSSVSAESMDPSKLKAQMSQVTNIPKDPEVAATLLRVVSKSPLLRTLDTEQKDMIIKAFSGPIVKPDGEDVIVQGELGDTFYLLEEGSVDVYIKKKGADDEIKVHTYKPGDAFGELAIMYNAPRAATCRVSGSAKLWVLDRISFKVIVVAAAMQKREKYQNFLGKVPLLESLTEMEVMTLADSLMEETYVDGSTICTQGDEGNYFYIILEGAAECSQVDGAGVTKIVASLTEGNYFGEIALMSSKPRQATVKASGKLKVLAIDRATFTRVFGSMEEIMQRNMEVYSKYAAQAI
jgi:cAMP-dependent protein kinase regulator